MDLRKVYTLSVTAAQTKLGLDWQNRSIRAACRSRSFTKTFNSLDDATLAMEDARKKTPPRFCEWETKIIEGFAFQDPSNRNVWHRLITQPVDIIE